MDDFEDFLENPEDLFAQIEDSLNSSKSGLNENTIKVGYIQKIFSEIKPKVLLARDNPQNDGTSQEYYKGTILQLTSLRDFSRDLSLRVGSLSPFTDSMLSATEVISTSTGSYVSAYIPDHFENNIETCFPPFNNFSHYGELLNQIDSELSDTYKQIWEILFGTESESKKGSLFMARQFLDHFFSILAPDDLVKDSCFFHTKAGDNPHEIYREERLNYAANQFIHDEKKKDFAVNSTSIFLKLYKNLNKAHSRKILDSGQVNLLLNQVRSLVEFWIDSINFSELLTSI